MGEVSACAQEGNPSWKPMLDMRNLALPLIPEYDMAGAVDEGSKLSGFQRHSLSGEGEVDEEAAGITE